MKVASQLGAMLLALAVAGCGGAAESVVDPPRPASGASQLGAFMRANVNPNFSRLSFMIFHADPEAEDEDTAQQLAEASANLAVASREIAGFSHLVARGDEAKAVFETFANLLVVESDALTGHVAKGDREAASASLERISEACNSCHHFYRLKPVGEASFAVGGARRLP